MTTHRETMMRFAIPFGRVTAMTALLALAACSGNKTENPDGSHDGPQRLVTGEGYRFAVGGTKHNTAIAARDVTASGNAKLELIEAGKSPVELSTAALPEAIQVAADPHRALFLDGAGDVGTGVLTLVDVEDASKRTVPEGGGVPTDGFYFGANGDQILFIGAFNAGQNRGALFHSTGALSERKGEGTMPAAVLFTPDRTTAVVGLEISTASDSSFGVGKLAVVRMGSGLVQVVAEDVRLVGKAGARFVRLFSMSDDGSKVAYGTASGQVAVVSSSGGEPVVVAQEGQVPGLSSDGAQVAWYSGDGVWVKTLAGESEARKAATLPASTARTGPPPAPVFMPGNQRIVYLTTWSWFPRGVIGDTYIAPVASGAPVRAGGNVAWESIRFLPSGGVALLAEVQNLVGTADYQGGLGKLRLGSPELEFTEAASGIPAGDMAVLADDTATDVVYIGDVQRRSTPVGEGFRARVAEEIATKRAATGALPRSLRQLGNRVAFIGNIESQRLADESVVGTLVMGKLGSDPVPQNYNKVVRVGFTPNQRVIAVIAGGANAGVMTFPVK